MSSKVSLRTLFAIIAVVAVALAVWLQGRQVVENRRLKQENQRLQEEVAQAHFDLEMARIDMLLKVPTEALYLDWYARNELNRIRWQALKENGAEEEFVPVSALYAHRPDSPISLESYRKMERNMINGGGFWEDHALSHADDGPQRLNGMLKSSEEFRQRLLADTELKDEYLKPLLLRLMRCREEQSRLCAIEALLLLGDRRAELLSIIRDDLVRLSGTPPRTLHAGVVHGDESAQDMVRVYQWLILEHELANLIRTISVPAEAATAED